MPELKSLPASDIKNISKVLLKWLRNCPAIPSDLTLKYQFLDTDSGISLHTLKGAVKKHEYIDGGYDGKYPFAIYLRGIQDSTNSRLDIESTLNSIGEWVDNQSVYPSLDYLEIDSISWVTNAILVKRFDNGVEDYMITFELLFTVD